jgi:demethylmenaquinone methyltransferase/2-methoxy-6-polyprenyl-1,4-benzoquinol methylase
MTDDPRRSYFDEIAAQWDEEGPSGEDMVAHLARAEQMLGLQGGQNVLEVGCGTGKTTAYLVQAVSPGRVTAVDFAPKMIDAAREKGIDADFRVLDVCDQAPPAERYELVLCFHCFPHFRDQPAATRHLARACKPGGRFVVMHMRPAWQINDFHASLSGAVGGDRLPVGQDEWAPLLDQAGLRMVRLIDDEQAGFFLEARPVPTGD